MKTRPIYQNLDTSFVNLSALIRHLRRLEFTGNIRVELSGYEADVTLSAGSQPRVREHDRVFGRISEGEESLQRLLIRAREPGGIISVYQESEESAPAVEPIAPVVEEISPAAEVNRTAEIEPIVVDAIPLELHLNGHCKKAQRELPPPEDDFPVIKSNPLKMPFELSNNFEAKARQTSLPPHDWQMLLNVTAELLDTIDKTLAEANLEFSAAFEKARSEIANDYPFLNPSAGIFNYKNGKITVREQVGAKLFAAGINESLRRILEKLGKNPKFLNIYLTTVQKIIVLIEKRQAHYDKFSITPQLSKNIGI